MNSWNKDHVASYYAASANDRRLRPQLEDEISTSVCIIGAGFTGISAALELIERGFSVVVVEEKRVGFGASGRNGGQIVNGYSRDLSTIAKRYGAERAAHLGAMSLEGGQIIKERVAKYAIDCDLVEGGFLAALSKKQFKAMQKMRDVWQKFGHDGLETVPQLGVTRCVYSQRYVGGLIDHYGGHLHPLNLALGEAAAFEAQGGLIFENSPVISLEMGQIPVVHTAHAKIVARYVLVCGNAYLGGLLPTLSERIMPVSSQILATEPLEGLAQMLLPANYCVEDANYVLDYFRRTKDNRLLYGGGVGYGGQDPADLTAAIRPNMIKTFPQLEKVKIDYVWSGNFALTLTRIPHVGKLSDHVYFSHGDSGHGVTTTHLLGKILGEMVAGHAMRFDIWSSLPSLPFPGGRRFRVSLTALGAWWYRMRDKLGI